MTMEQERVAKALATKPIVSATPISGGRQTGKLLLTFSDGTRALFKPASGEREGRGLNE